MEDPLPRLQQLGFRRRKKPSDDDAIDVVVDDGRRRYAVAVKSIRDVRTSQLDGLLADAFLRLRAAASDLVPMVVLVAPRWSAAMTRHVLAYRARYLGDCGVALLDADGGIELVAGDRHVIERAPRKPRSRSSGPNGNLFTDLNQWLLKILIKSSWKIDAGYLTGPVGHYEAHRDLAAAAGVSVSRTWHLLELLRHGGFFTQSLIRIDDLLDRWRHVSMRGRHLGVRWPLGTDAPLQRLQRSLRGLASWERVEAGGSVVTWKEPRRRACLGGVAAAYALGHGFVSGALPEVYVEHLDTVALQKFGVRAVETGESPHFVVVVPRFKETLFRACAPGVDGTPTADVVQTWLDVVDRPERGSEQAEILRQRVLHAPDRR